MSCLGLSEPWTSYIEVSLTTRDQYHGVLKAIWPDSEYNISLACALREVWYCLVYGRSMELSICALKERDINSDIFVQKKTVINCNLSARDSQIGLGLRVKQCCSERQFCYVARTTLRILVPSSHWPFKCGFLWGRFGYISKLYIITVPECEIHM